MSTIPKERVAAPSLGNRLGRAAWAVVWLLLFRPTPRPLHFWRRWLVRAFGGKIGPGAHIYPSARIWAPWNLVMGRNAVLADDVECYNVAVVEIRDGGKINQRSYACTASRDLDDPTLPLMIAPIVVEPNGWTGADVFLAPGVTIRTGGVALARAVVTKDVPEWTVVGGHPAKPISQRKRF